MGRHVSITAAVCCLAAARAAAAPPAQEEHVRGVVSSLANGVVTVKSADGSTRQLRLGDKTRVSVATPANTGAIAKGEYVGTTAVQAPDGSLRALEVHVFPESMRGAGEGHRPWDLRPGSTMTNAKVSGVAAEGQGSQSTMTNANVSGVAAAPGGEQLSLSYAGGQKTVLVAPGTPVVRLEPADRSAIAAGGHVFAAGARQPDGSIAVDRMVVGKDGAIPPM